MQQPGIESCSAISCITSHKTRTVKTNYHSAKYITANKTGGEAGGGREETKEQQLPRNKVIRCNSKHDAAAVIII